MTNGTRGMASKANPGGGDALLPVAEAMRILLACAAPLGTEPVALDRAAGRFLAEGVLAPEDMPPFDRSMMDGYAIRSADAPARAAGAAGTGAGGAAAIPAVLQVVGFIPAGRPAAGIEVLPGQAVRIMTGAPIPAGADAVQKIEKTEEIPGTTRTPPAACEYCRASVPARTSPARGRT